MGKHIRSHLEHENLCGTDDGVILASGVRVEILGPTIKEDERQSSSDSRSNE